MDIVERLKFDATRCEMQFSNGVASNITEAIAQIELLRSALTPFANYADQTRKISRSFEIGGGSSMARRQITMGDCYDAWDALLRLEQRLEPEQP